MKTWAEINAIKYGGIALSMIQATNLSVNDFVREDWPPSFRIVHSPSGNYFAFGGDDGGAMWSRPGYPGSTNQTGRGHYEAWDTKIRFFKAWLERLQELLAAIADHSKGEPTFAGEGGDHETRTAEFRISGPDDIDLLLEAYADGYVWKFHNKSLQDLERVRLEVISARSFDEELGAFRKARTFEVRWRPITNLNAGDLIKWIRLFGYKSSHLEFGNTNGEGELFWPSGDPRASRRWLLSLRVVGLSRDWPIELDLQWKLGTKTVELTEYCDSSARDQRGLQDRYQEPIELGKGSDMRIFPAQEYPKYMHHASKSPMIVNSKQEQDGLGSEWSEAYISRGVWSISPPTAAKVRTSQPRQVGG